MEIRFDTIFNNNSFVGFHQVELYIVCALSLSPAHSFVHSLVDLVRSLNWFKLQCQKRFISKCAQFEGHTEASACMLAYVKRCSNCIIRHLCMWLFYDSLFMTFIYIYFSCLPLHLASCVLVCASQSVSLVVFIFFLFLCSSSALLTFSVSHSLATNVTTRRGKRELNIHTSEWVSEWACKRECVCVCVCLC